ncbi:MAG: lactose transporter permease, partial [Paucimonas sp.]|nr:lactose transporter permease [Paucimonas sp.]
MKTDKRNADKMLTSSGRQTLHAYLFLAPALVLLAVFSNWPVGYGAYLSFTDFNVINPEKWVGWLNYVDIFDNEMFVSGLLNSLKFLLIVPVIQIIGIGLAVLVNQHLPGIQLFRTAYYLPVVTTVSVVGIMWQFMFHESGSLNYVLTELHILKQPVGWLLDDSTALYAVMFVTVWRGIGWYMVLYLAALQSIPSEMQEAAILDGANRWQRFIKITIPMLLPTIMVCSVMSSLAALKAYQEVDVLTQGGPMNSTFTALFYSYDQGFKHLQFARGLASSVIVSLFCIVAGL